MDFIEKTGKNVEEALNDALAELKTTADKVNVEVIEEAKNGIFGLFAKKAKIRVTLKDAAKKIGGFCRLYPRCSLSRDAGFFCVPTAGEVRRLCAYISTCVR